MEDKIALRVVQNALITLDGVPGAGGRTGCRAPAPSGTPRAVLRVTRAGRGLVGRRLRASARTSTRCGTRRERQQFGRPIGGFQLVQDLLARMLGNIIASQCMVVRLAQLAGRRHAARRAGLAGQGLLHRAHPGDHRLGPGAARRQRDPARSPRRPFRRGRRSDLLVRGDARDQQSHRRSGDHRHQRLRLTGRGRLVDRMSATDAGFYFAEGENTPDARRVGRGLRRTGAVLRGRGPAAARQAAAGAALPAAGRARCRCTSAGRCGWTTSTSRSSTTSGTPRCPVRAATSSCATWPAGCSASGWTWPSRCGRSWLVEGLEDGRWALISKVHHCMVDGVAGTDLMQLIFDIDPDAAHPEPVGLDAGAGPVDRRRCSPAPARDASSHPVRQLGLAAGAGPGRAAPRALLRARRRRSARTLPGAGPAAAPRRRPASLNGPIGPHRRWAWAETSLDAVKQVRAGLGGTVNDVVLAAITRGFRDLLAGPRRADRRARGALDGAGVGAPARPSAAR